MKGDLGRAVNWEKLARSFVHPLRISILEALALDGGRVLSVKDLGHELQEPLAKTAYHVSELHKKGHLELVRVEPVRGTVEHFYRAAEDV